MMGTTTTPLPAPSLVQTQSSCTTEADNLPAYRKAPDYSTLIRQPIGQPPPSAQQPPPPPSSVSAVQAPASCSSTTNPSSSATANNHQQVNPQTAAQAPPPPQAPPPSGVDPTQQQQQQQQQMIYADPGYNSQLHNSQVNFFISFIFRYLFKSEIENSNLILYISFW